MRALAPLVVASLLLAPVRVTPAQTPAAPAVGQAAPDFELTSLRFHAFGIDEREITRSNAGELYAPVRLDAFRGVKPVALVFGSDSGHPSRHQLAALEGLHRTYGDRLQFLFVYIAGAGSPAREPRTSLERMRAANQFVGEQGISIPCLIDGMDDASMKAYAAHPARLFLVDAEGRIAFAGGPARDGLDVASFEAAIEMVLGVRAHG